MADLKIGDEVYIHGFVDEVRRDTVIIKNEGGYFGTVTEEIMPSAQPDLLDDGTLLITVPHGMLEKVKRVMVDEVGTKFCKTMYQDEPEQECEKCIFKPFKQFPERKKGEWIDYTEDGFVECPFCHSATNCDGNKDELRFCFSCGAELR